MRDIDSLIVHCAATTSDWDIGADEIKGLHTAPKDMTVPWKPKNLKGKGWSDCGYHAVIRRNGRVEDGRPIERPGAHARGYNAHSIAICLIGGVDEHGKPEDNFTPEQKDTLRRFIDMVREVEYPEIEIKGHRDLPGVNKACPCFDVRAWYYKEEA